MARRARSMYSFTMPMALARTNRQLPMIRLFYRRAGHPRNHRVPVPREIAHRSQIDRCHGPKVNRRGRHQNPAGGRSHQRRRRPLPGETGPIRPRNPIPRCLRYLPRVKARQPPRHRRGVSSGRTMPLKKRRRGQRNSRTSTLLTLPPSRLTHTLPRRRTV